MPRNLSGKPAIHRQVHPCPAASAFRSTTRYRPCDRGATLLSSEVGISVAGHISSRTPAFRKAELKRFRTEAYQFREFADILFRTAADRSPRLLPNRRFWQSLFFCNLNKPPPRNRFISTKRSPSEAPSLPPAPLRKGAFANTLRLGPRPCVAGGSKEQEGRSAPSSCLLKFWASGYRFPFKINRLLTKPLTGGASMKELCAELPGPLPHGLHR